MKGIFPRLLPYNIFRFAILVLLVAGSYSCMMATGYQPGSFPFNYGYSESRIGDNIYRVDYLCSEKTPLSQCEGHLYRRCAELTRNAGYDYFVIDEYTSYIRKSDRSVPGYYQAFDHKSGPTTYMYVPGHVETTAEPTCRAKITMRRGTKPPDDPKAFTPGEILRNAQSH